MIPLAKNKPAIIDKVNKVAAALRKARFGRVEIEAGNIIGKACRRHDEMGTPCCITIDFETICAEDGDPKIITP